MDDIVGRIFSYVAGILFMFFVPLSISMLISDNVTQRYVENSLERFKDVCLTSGEISEENYERLISNLSSSGYVYDIKIEHYECSSYSQTGHSLTAGNYLGHGHDEIIEQITARITTDSNGNSVIVSGTPYKMNNGDYLKITVSSKDDTYGSKIANAFTFGALSKNKVYGMDSGMVRANM